MEGLADLTENFLGLPFLPDLSYPTSHCPSAHLPYPLTGQRCSSCKLHALPVPMIP